MTVYSTMVRPTSKALTPGEAAAIVGSTPNTMNGWRPISVKIQPNEMANSDDRGAANISPVHSLPGFGSSSLRVIHRVNAPIAIDRKPRPIIRRKVQ